MAWRVANSLIHLRDQVNKMFPTRSKESDGTIGDAQHASRSSDHNPWVKDGGEGIVTAMDLTHDPSVGFDSYKFADWLMEKKDPRIKYVISNRRIGSGSDGPAPWVWRKYTGSNPHDHHVHISVKSDKKDYDNTKDWDIGSFTMGPADPNYVSPPATLRQGSRGDDVKQLQALLNTKGASLDLDGEFGPVTKKAVMDFQKETGLGVDGIVGPQTWGALHKA